MFDICGSDGLKEIIKGTRLGRLSDVTLTFKATVRGMSVARCICLERKERL